MSMLLFGLGQVLITVSLIGIIVDGGGGEGKEKMADRICMSLDALRKPETYQDEWDRYYRFALNIPRKISQKER